MAGKHSSSVTPRTRSRLLLFLLSLLFYTISLFTSPSDSLPLRSSPNSNPGADCSFVASLEKFLAKEPEFIHMSRAIANQSTSLLIYLPSARGLRGRGEMAHGSPAIRELGGKIRSKLGAELSGAEGIQIEEGTVGEAGKEVARDGMRKLCFTIGRMGQSTEHDFPIDAVQPGWLLTFLRSISPSQIREMRTNLAKYARHFLYSILLNLWVLKIWFGEWFASLPCVHSSGVSFS